MNSKPNGDSADEVFNFSTLPRSGEREFAQSMDQKDPLKHLRESFHIPSQKSLNTNTLLLQDGSQHDEPGIYLCGNQIGLQPRQTPLLIQKHLKTWATQGMYGLAKKMEDSPLPTWGEADRVAAQMMAPIVGGDVHEVSVMGSLTTNLHVLMASFYQPRRDRTKIITERDAFSSDYYAIQSQLQWHNLDVNENLVLIEPVSDYTLSLSTSTILSIIETHASSAALIILSGVQYLTGQVLDMAKITSFAHSKGITVGWDLAHAVGNVELHLHDWGVDFAVWCNYKYMNAGPGAISSIFVHQRHGEVERSMGVEGYRQRLAGWWGNDFRNRFEMQNSFVPSVGAAGYQISNASNLDIIALIASLEIFNLTCMSAIRRKSVLLTGYLEYLLLGIRSRPFEIMTSTETAERGAQLSLRFDKHQLDCVMASLKKKGIVLAQKQDIMRVAPAPLYNTFTEVWEFATELKYAILACEKPSLTEKGI